MTIAIGIKVSDGLVLAADSAATLIGPVNGATQVVQVYNNANKVFNLVKGLPIGAMIWGSAAIGSASMSTLIKDLRVRLSGNNPAFPHWHLDPQTYTLQQVATFVRQFLYDELYVNEYAAWPTKPAFGILVGGYSAGSAVPERFLVSVEDTGFCNGPNAVTDVATWYGEPEAISRLWLGYSMPLPGLLAAHLQLPVADVIAAFQAHQGTVQAQLVYDAMPIQDAIDIADFLVELTKKYSRYTPGAATVGGPVEIAAITKHEGFKWVARKYYFRNELNPE